MKMIYFGKCSLFFLFFILILFSCDMGFGRELKAVEGTATINDSGILVSIDFEASNGKVIHVRNFPDGILKELGKVQSITSYWVDLFSNRQQVIVLLARTEDSGKKGLLLVLSKEGKLLYKSKNAINYWLDELIFEKFENEEGPFIGITTSGAASAGVANWEFFWLKNGEMKDVLWTYTWYGKGGLPTLVFKDGKDGKSNEVISDEGVYFWDEAKKTFVVTKAK